MIELAHDARTRDAYRTAHEERARAFARAFGWLRFSRSVPLDRMALTEPSRCA